MSVQSMVRVALVMGFVLGGLPMPSSGTAAARDSLSSSATVVSSPPELSSSLPVWRSDASDRPARDAAIAAGLGARQVAAGANHTCALTPAGAVKCWGSGGSGQLGDGTTTEHDVPTDVFGLSSGVSAIAAGGYGTCALTSAGAVKCWGSNGVGQLGDGTTTERHTPTAVFGLSSGVSAIATGDNHSCAITSAGAVECWGANGYGQLGDNTTTDRHTPTAVSDLSSGVVAITADGNNTCAITSAGAVKCWGYNSSGRIGDGTFTDRYTPTDVFDLSSGVSEIAFGPLHTCALTSAGAVKCWGSNGYGQLGDGTTTDRHTPTVVSGFSSGVTAITIGAYHTCALTLDGAVKCWGGNGNGQLGDGTTTDRLVPTDVSDLPSGVAAITSHYLHTCALTSAGVVECWGYNSNGRLGDGTTTDRHTPVVVLGFEGIMHVFLPLILRPQ